MAVSARGEPPVVEFMQAYDPDKEPRSIGSLDRIAAEKLESATDGQMRFEVMHHVVDSSCVDLDEAVAAFYTALTSVIESRVSLSENAGDVVEAVIYPVLFTIQVPTPESMMKIVPSPTADVPIYQASLNMYRVVQRCYRDVEGEVRELLF